MGSIQPLMQRNFLEYASYVIIDRAIPDLRDGCKPVQRRILHTLWEMDDGRFHKVANVIGETMKLHPHGDASIGDALVVLANKDYFIEKQGNFGNVLTGHPAAAARYIECRLTPLARETLFNPHLTEWQPSYDGRKKEPVVLPAKIPVVLMLGTEGIAVGMSTRILPHNFAELLRAQIAILRKEPFELLPDFPQGGSMDVTEYDDGAGRIRVRARVEASKDRKTITIREIPYSTTTESLIASIEAAAQKGKVQVASIEDRTAESVEIVLHLKRGAYSDEVIPQLWAHTQCEVSISSGVVVIDGRRPAAMRPREILEALTKRLVELLRRELQHELEQLEDKQHFLTLEQIFIEKRVYKKIEAAKTAPAVRRAVRNGMEPYRDLMVRELTDDDVERLLEIRIRRISAYDIARNRTQLEEVATSLRAVKRKLRSMTRTSIAYLEDLLDRYGERYPRRTRVERFQSVDKRAVSVQNLKLSYDPKTSLYGTQVRGSAFETSVSEFDKVIAVCSDGTLRIGPPPKRALLPKKVLHIGPFDVDNGSILTLVYRDGERKAWAKKVHVKSFINDKVYRLFKDPKGKIDHLWVGETDARVHVLFVPQKRQRVREATFDLSQLDVSGLAARGTRIAPKPVATVRIVRS